MSTHVDQVLNLLPETGRPILYGEVITRARDLGLDATAARAALLQACAEGRAASEVRGAHSFVWRLSVAAAVEPRARAMRPPPRRPRAAALAGAR